MNTALFRVLFVHILFLLGCNPSIAGVIFSTSYLASEGFLNAPLNQNTNWRGGSQVAVRPGTTGFVTNGAALSQDPTYNIRGARGNAPNNGFSIGDVISIKTQLQFTLPGNAFAQELARFGFSDSFSTGSQTPALQAGFGVVWDRGLSQPNTESGYVRFFPDFNDYVLIDDSRPVNQNNSFTIEGRYVGLDVFNTRGQGADFRSNPFEIDYTAKKISSSQWNVEELRIRDTVTNAAFFYDFSFQQPQTFNFTGTNAFFGQRIVVQGRDSNRTVATSEFVTFNYTSAPVPEPSTFFVFAFGLVAWFICSRNAWERFASNQMGLTGLTSLIQRTTIYTGEQSR